MTGGPELDALRERLAYDTPFFARHCLWIANKERKLQRLEPLPWQARTPETPAHMTPLDEALETQRAGNQPMRVIILKARKLGMSTWVQAKAMQRVTQLSLQSSLTVCHRADATVELADMAGLMYERLPTDHMLAELVYGPNTTNAAPFTVRPYRLGEGTSRNGIRFMEFGAKERKNEKSVYRTMTAGRARRRPRRDAEHHSRLRVRALRGPRLRRRPVQRAPAGAGDDRDHRVHRARLQPLPQAVGHRCPRRGGPGDGGVVAALVLRVAGQPPQPPAVHLRPCPQPLRGHDRR
jgi:hypothetical protein